MLNLCCRYSRAGPRRFVFRAIEKTLVTTGMDASNMLTASTPDITENETLSEIRVANDLFQPESDITKIEKRGKKRERIQLFSSQLCVKLLVEDLEGLP